MSTADPLTRASPTGGCWSPVVLDGVLMRLAEAVIPAGDVTA